MVALVILLLISILAVVSLSTFASFHKASLRSNEARKIAKLLSTARSYAIAQNRYYQAAVWLDRSCYWIDETNAAGAVVRPKITTPEPVDELIEIADITVDSTLYTNGLVRIRFSQE